MTIEKMTSDLGKIRRLMVDEYIELYGEKPLKIGLSNEAYDVISRCAQTVAEVACIAGAYGVSDIFGIEIYPSSLLTKGWMIYHHEGGRVRVVDLNTKMTWEFMGLEEEWKK